MMVISCHLVIEFALETWIRRMTGTKKHLTAEVADDGDQLSFGD